MDEVRKVPAGGTVSKPSNVKRRKSFARQLTDTLSMFIPGIYLDARSTTSQKDLEEDTITEELPAKEPPTNLAPVSCSKRPPHYPTSSRNPQQATSRRYDTRPNYPMPSSQTLGMYDPRVRQPASLPGQGTSTDHHKDVFEDSLSEMSDHSIRSVSTSGVSSLHPHTDNQREEQYLHMSARSGSSYNRSRRFDKMATISEPSCVLSHSMNLEKRRLPYTLQSQSKRQRLNPNITSSFTESCRQSSFYPGRTTYGGFSSVQTEYPVRPKPIVQERVTPLPCEVEVRGDKRSRNVSVMSSTARRILDSLEKVSSTQNSGSGFGQRIIDSVQPRVVPSNVQRSRTIHYTPYSSGYRSFLNRQKTSTTPNSPATNATVRERLECDKETPGTLGKIREKRFLNESSSVLPSRSLTTVDHLPCLAAANIPTLNFPLFTASSVNKPLEEQNISAPKGSPKFQFSVPKIVTSNSVDLGGPSELLDFDFSSPKCKTTEFIPKRRPQATSSSIIPQINVQSCSVLDVLSQSNSMLPKQSTIQLKTVDLDAEQGEDTLELKKLKEKTAAEWTCDTCMLSNSSESTSCVACETARPGNSKCSEETQELKKLKEKTAAEWTCDTCMLSNSSERTSCVACETARPGNSKCSEETQELKKLKEKTAAEWTCDTCMLSNSSEKTSCVACETARPGNSKCSEETHELKKLKEKTAAEWTCDTCMLSNSSEKTSCVACETARPGNSKCSEETQELKKLKEKKTTIESVSNNTFKSSFVLPTATTSGFSLPCSTSKSSSFSFGAPSSISAPSKSLSFGAPPNVVFSNFTKPPFSSGIPLNVGSSNKNETTTPQISFGAPVSTIDNVSNAPAINPEVIPSNKMSTFTFGAASSNPNVTISISTTPLSNTSLQSTGMIFGSNGTSNIRTSTTPDCSSQSGFAQSQSKINVAPLKFGAIPFSSTSNNSLTSAYNGFPTCSNPIEKSIDTGSPFVFGKQSSDTSSLTTTVQPSSSLSNVKTTSSSSLFQFGSAPSVSNTFNFNANSSKPSGFGNTVSSQPAFGSSSNNQTVFGSNINGPSKENVAITPILFGGSFGGKSHSSFSSANNAAPFPAITRDQSSSGFPGTTVGVSSFNLQPRQQSNVDAGGPARPKIRANRRVKK